MVILVVTLVPEVVLVAWVGCMITLSGHGDSDDDDEWAPGCKLVDGGDEGNGEENGDEEEVDIGQSFELQQQGF